jgi:peptidyl-prolyl cis-trans isomerase D
MFDLFRSRAKAVRYLLGALLLLVAVSMVVTLIPGFGSGVQGDPQIVAEVGKQALSLTEVQQAIQAQLRGRSLPAGMAQAIVPQIATSMVTEYAVAYQAEQMGFRVSESDMASAIRTIFPQLFNGDQFAGKEAYAAVLAQQNMTVSQFEAALRRQLLMSALRGMVVGSVIVSPKDVETEYHLRNDKAKIEYVTFPPSKYRSEVTVTPEEIKAFYDKNRTGFLVPQTHSFAALIVDEAKLTQSITVPDADLRRVYEQTKDTFRLPERVNVRHILLKTTDKPKQETPKIRAKAEELLKQLKQGTDFAALAKKNSEDTVSAAKGGDLGWIARGQTVKAFEDTAFSIKPKEISGIITTEYGFHILQVLERQEAHLRPFEEVRPQLTEERKKQMVFDRMQALSDQARAALVKNPNGAEQVARELDLQLVRAEKVGSGAMIAGIGLSRELDDALVSLRKGEVSSVVQIAPTKLAVAVVTDVFPARQAEISEVEGQIRETLTGQKLAVLVDKKVAEGAGKAKALNGNLKALAQSMGLELKTPPEFTRDGAVEGLGSAGYVEAAFSRPVGEVIGPVTVGDNRAVYKIVARTPADETQLVEQHEALADRLRSQRAQERVGLFEDGIMQRLVKEGKVKIHQDAIKRLVTNYSGS